MLALPPIGFGTYLMRGEECITAVRAAIAYALANAA